MKPLQIILITIITLSIINITSSMFLHLTLDKNSKNHQIASKLANYCKINDGIKSVNENNFQKLIEYTKKGTSNPIPIYLKHNIINYLFYSCKTRQSPKTIAKCLYLVQEDKYKQILRLILDEAIKILKHSPTNASYLYNNSLSLFIINLLNIF